MIETKDDKQMVDSLMERLEKELLAEGLCTVPPHEIDLWAKRHWMLRDAKRFGQKNASIRDLAAEIDTLIDRPSTKWENQAELDCYISHLSDATQADLGGDYLWQSLILRDDAPIGVVLKHHFMLESFLFGYLARAYPMLDHDRISDLQFGERVEWATGPTSLLRDLGRPLFAVHRLRQFYGNDLSYQVRGEDVADLIAFNAKWMPVRSRPVYHETAPVTDFTWLACQRMDYLTKVLRYANCGIDEYQERYGPFTLPAHITEPTKSESTEREDDRFEVKRD